MINSYFHLLFIILVTLFPVINPVRSALIVYPYFLGLSEDEKKAAVRKIAFYVFCLCIFFLFTGHLLLTLFGITILLIQFAGGITIYTTGWESLTSDSAKSDSHIEISSESMATVTKSTLSDKLFYPIKFPITMGGGVISVLFTLGVHSVNANITIYMINTLATITAVIIMCILIMLFYLNTKL